MKRKSRAATLWAIRYGDDYLGLHTLRQTESDAWKAAGIDPSKLRGGENFTSQQVKVLITPIVKRKGSK